MKHLFQISLLVLTLFAVSSVNNTATAQKIAVVDTEALLAASPEVRRANSQLQALKGQFEKRLKVQYDKMQKKYSTAMQQAQAGQLSEAQQQAVAKDLQAMQANIAKSEQKMQGDLIKKEEDYIKPILEKLKKNITAVAKTKGYSYVFNKNSMIYFPPSDDITNLVKKKLGYK
ncbi:MAG: OmpH family outer membrane protein [Saprospiraceae bacterium]